MRWKNEIMTSSWVTENYVSGTRHQKVRLWWALSDRPRLPASYILVAVWPWSKLTRAPGPSCRDRFEHLQSLNSDWKRNVTSLDQNDAINTYNRLNHQPAGVYALPARWLGVRSSFWASKGHARAATHRNNFHLWTFHLYRDWPLFCQHYYVEPCSPLAQFQDTADVDVRVKNSRNEFILLVRAKSHLGVVHFVLKLR